MSGLTERIVGTLWTVVAAVTIVAAILISIIRLMLPHIDQQRDSIEIWLSEITNRPVQIGEVRASWKGWAPTIDVSNLVLFGAARKTELVRFDYAAIEISIFTSLWQQHLVPRRLLVGGMRVALERDVNGQISIAGLPPSRWPVAQWLLEQQNFALRDADISFTDAMSDSAPMHFTDVTVAITHDGGQQLITGGVRRDSGANEQYLFELRTAGDILTSNWDGDLFLDIRNAQVGATLALSGLTENQIAGGQLNAKSWSRWEGASLQRATIELEGSGLKIAGQNSTIVDAIDARGVAVRHPDGWSLALDQLRFESAHEAASESTASIRWRDRGEQSAMIAFRANNVNLADAMSLAQGHVGIGGSVMAEFSELGPRANIDEVVGAAFYTDGHISRYFFEASVNDLSVAESARTPGVSGFDFTVRANNNGGMVDPSQTGGVQVLGDDWLVEPVEVQKIHGNILWQNAPEGLNISTEHLQIRTESIDFSTRGGIKSADTKNPLLDFVTRIDSGELPRLHTLIPKNLLRPSGEKWLRNAFLSGRFQPSGLIVRGYLNDFPFDQHTGTFKGSFDVTDVDLKYSAKFPMTSAITATVTVDGRKIETSMHSGRVYGAAVDGSTVEMPDLFSPKPMVRMRGDLRVTPDDVGKFIEESPLHATKASRYANVEISGDFDLTLDMNLGLYPGADKEVLGLVRFSDNRIHSSAQGITLEKVTGDISFTRQDLYGEGLTAVFDGDPVGVIFNGGLDDPNYDTEFRMTGTSSASQLSKYLERYAPMAHDWLIHGADENAITGRLPWKAVLTIPAGTGTTPGAPKRLVLESSLVGLYVDLPWPFRKTSAEKKSLTIRTETSFSGERLTRIDFGSAVGIEIDSARQADGTNTTSRVEMILGDATPEFAHTPGLTARGRTPRLPLSEWVGLAKRVAASGTSQGSDLPISFNVDIDNLETLGRNFTNINLTGGEQPDAWHVSVSGPQAQGTMIIPREYPERSLTLDFERLWLERFDPENRSVRIDPRTIPSFVLNAKSLRFGEIDLGTVELTTRRVENGVKLDRLQASEARFTLQGDGDWLLHGDVHQCRINLTVYDKTLSGLLQRFDYEVANIDGGKTKIGIEAIWDGMPSEFTLDKLYGSFELHVDKGRFLDIDPGSGRLFGLLSLQTLPRRLSLDFNDLFKKGFTFDGIDGVFELDHGNAYTNSLLMNGPSARIDISGRTGLADQDYDQRVTVTPALSNTIPVASALFGPAGIGVGAVIFLGQKMFKSIPEHVDKFLSREYSITGGWEQPVIERI